MPGRTSGFRRRPTGNTIYDCSVRRRLHSDNLWAVAWNPLFNAFPLFFMSGGLENRKNGLNFAFSGS